MSVALRFVFFLSGCAALLFETLWFRQAGLMLGNSVWSSSIVLASFMAGLAAGNALAARHGLRLRRPVGVYAALEVVIGLTGLALVLAFPLLTRSVSPLVAGWFDSQLLLNAARLALAFGLLLVPSSAMGATLPVLVPALGGDEARFGRSLGQLYGWNTLGAVVGSLAGEMKLIELFGVTGCAALAASLNLTAALVASRFARWRTDAVPAADTAPAVPRAGELRGAWPLLAAAFLAGALLLALEVIWFRFLLLSVMGTGAAFAIMLAAVLAGIALGGLVASVWLERHPSAEHAVAAVALVAGATVVWTYSAFESLPHMKGGLVISMSGLGLAAALLMLPTSLASGLLFTLIGQALRRRFAGETRTAGVLTLANTLGAMTGALVGGLLLLPGLGIETSLFALGCGYGVVALLGRGAAAGKPAGARPVWLATAGGAAAFTAALALFPFGLMKNVYLARVWARFEHDTVAVWREGLTETMAYLVVKRWDEPVQYRLITNGHSMSGTSATATRYMRLFSYMPLALVPEARSALVISFGLGSTLDALLDSSRLETVHVVDISRDIFSLGRVAYPPPRRYPLDDPRVQAHVEDGRFFLLTTPLRFDIITAEPPPPKHAGIVNLYSKEYFELLHERLETGGMATYWLPVAQLGFDDTRAILRGFCDVFADCTLWTGIGLEWMVVGTRGARAPDEPGFTAPWREPRTQWWLREMGLHVPEQLGTTFLADAEQLQPWLRDARPLEDDFPLRLTHHLPARLAPQYIEMLRADGARRRFAESKWIAAMWPPRLHAATLERFEDEKPVLEFLSALGQATWLPELAAMAGDPTFRTAVLWMMRRSPAVERAALLARGRGLRDPELDVMLGIAAFADGRFLEAERYFHGAQRHVLAERIVQWRVLALVLGGERERAARLMTEAGDWVHPDDEKGWRYLSATYSLPDPWGLLEAEAAARPQP